MRLPRKDLTEPVVIVHGGCPTGADAYASRVAVFWNLEQEVHDADWKKHGRAAGPIRNQKMVDAGADVCLAFPTGGPGTRDCMRRADAAGIRVIDMSEKGDDGR